MASESAKATGNANQTSVQKEQFIANNVENIAPGGTEKNATTAGNAECGFNTLVAYVYYYRVKRRPEDKTD